MTSKYIPGALIIALSFALCTPAEAQGASGTIGPPSHETIAGVIVGVVAGVAVLVIVAVH